jgi:NitT/TauT family transport system substrate-binding protein
MTETITINLLWQAQAQFAGYLMAESRNLGACRGVRITTTPLDFAMGPVKSVLSGVSDFGVASPAHILESDDPDALRMVLMIQQDSPLIYAVRRDSGINSLADLAGRKISVWPGGEDLEFSWMLHQAGIPQAAVERVPVSDTVAAFVDGTVASAQKPSTTNYTCSKRKAFRAAVCACSRRTSSARRS